MNKNINSIKNSQTTMIDHRGENKHINSIKKCSTMKMKNKIWLVHRISETKVVELQIQRMIVEKENGII